MQKEFQTNKDKKYFHDRITMNLIEFIITTFLSIYDALRDTLSNGEWSASQGDKLVDVRVRGLKA